MEALKNNQDDKRVVLPHLESSIGQCGVREGDEFLLDIFQERKRNFKLNRTQYTISLDSKFEFDFVSAHIQLPGFGDHKGRFRLELVNETSAKEHNYKSRYLFKSLEEFPFRLNGVYCFEAFLERGDIIDLGFNRIRFLKPDSLKELSEMPSESLIRSHIPILIEGETGTGKTTIAKKIHEESGRAGRFVHLNLSSFSQGLIESEIFGHVKGAFTGAIVSKKGAILEAHRGTLFLDEVDSLSMDLQTKLLLFFDNYEVRPVGGESFSKADVRVIVASGSDLKNRVESQQMRKDFYFRLKSGYSMKLESLRDDPQRISNLCQQFEEEHLVIIDKDLLAFYSTCLWPGNIRQLYSHLMKKKIMAEGKKIIFDDTDKELLGDNFKSSGAVNREYVSLERMKVRYCYEVFLKLDKNITRTAQFLELSINTLKAYLAKREQFSRDDNVININF